MNYGFTLSYQLAANDCDHEALIERLAEAGCDDATLGIGTRGRIALAFAREGFSARSAIGSALQNVRSAVPSARLIEVAFAGNGEVGDASQPRQGGAPNRLGDDR